MDAVDAVDVDGLGHSVGSKRKAPAWPQGCEASPLPMLFEFPVGHDEIVITPSS